VTRTALQRASHANVWNASTKIGAADGSFDAEYVMSLANSEAAAARAMSQNVHSKASVARVVASVRAAETAAAAAAVGSITLVSVKHLTCIAFSSAKHSLPISLALPFLLQNTSSPLFLPSFAILQRFDVNHYLHLLHLLTAAL
jgi:hypothetical protein